MPYYSNYKRNYKRSYALNKRYRRKQNTYRKWPVPSTKAIVQIPRIVEFNIKNYTSPSTDVLNISTQSIVSTSFSGLADMLALYDVYRVKSIVLTFHATLTSSNLVQRNVMSSYEKTPVDLSGLTGFTERANLLLEHDKSKLVALAGNRASTSLTWINDMQGDNADWISTSTNFYPVLGGIQMAAATTGSYSVACVLQFKNKG